MKKFLNTRNVLLLSGIFLAVLGFFLAFAAQLETSTSTITNVIIGKQYNVIPGLGKLSTTQYHSETSLAGIILMLVCGIIAVLLSFFGDAGWTKWVALVMAVGILTGGILVFFVKEGYAMAKVDAAINAGTYASSDRGYYIGVEMEKLASAKIGAIPYIVGVFGIIASGCFGVAQFIEE